MELGPTLTTERLILRPPCEADWDGFAAIHGDAEVMATLGGVTQSREDAWRALATYIGHWFIKGFGFFAVLERDTGALAGRVGPLEPGGWPAKEVGWTMARAHWGKGYAPEAARAALDWVFTELKWPEAAHFIEKDNVKSQAVARKLGAVVSHRFTGLPVPGGANLEIDHWVSRPR